MPHKRRVTFLRGDSHFAPDANYRIVNFYFRLDSPKRKWPTDTVLIVSPDQQGEQGPGVTVSPSRVSLGEKIAHFRVYMGPLNKSNTGRILIWLELRHGAKKQHEFEGDSKVFEAFLVSPTKIELDQAYPRERMDGKTCEVFHQPSGLKLASSTSVERWTFVSKGLKNDKDQSAALCFPADCFVQSEDIELIKSEKRFADDFGVRQYHHLRVKSNGLMLANVCYTYVKANFDEHRSALVDSQCVVFVATGKILRLVVYGVNEESRGECQACGLDGEVTICKRCECYWHKDCRKGRKCGNCDMLFDDMYEKDKGKEQRKRSLLEPSTPAEKVPRTPLQADPASPLLGAVCVGGDGAPQCLMAD